MMESAEYWERHHLSVRANHTVVWRNRHALLKPLVRAAPIEMDVPLIKHALQVRFTQDDDVIQAFAPYASKKALAPGIHERRLHCRSHDFHASTLRHSLNSVPNLLSLSRMITLGPSPNGVISFVQQARRLESGSI
jgi:hypothetical protein